MMALQSAVEFAERHKFLRHVKAWGAEHTGPGMRFVCESDAIDDPDHRSTAAAASAAASSSSAPAAQRGP